MKPSVKKTLDVNRLRIHALGLVVSIAVVGCKPTPARTEAPILAAIETPTRESTLEPSLEDPQANASLGDTWTRPADGMSMVFVPGGEFEMGSTQGDDDESPVHTVSIDDYWLDQTEVTNAQYELCVVAGACRPRVASWSDVENWPYGGGDYEDHPAPYVTWYQAETYCEWAGGRLPTEAEWEFAARGPEGWVFPWGDAFDGSRLNYCDGNCDRDWSDETVDDGFAATAPVGSYSGGASWCGALDMAGNVWEWVADWYALDYYGHSPSFNPQGPPSGVGRVLRGGSWGFDPFYVRSANRDTFLLPSNTYGHIGFRCAWGLE